MAEVKDSDLLSSGISDTGVRGTLAEISFSDGGSGSGAVVEGSSATEGMSIEVVIGGDDGDDNAACLLLSFAVAAEESMSESCFESELSLSSKVVLSAADWLSRVVVIGDEGKVGDWEGMFIGVDSAVDDES